LADYFFIWRKENEMRRERNTHKVKEEELKVRYSYPCTGRGGP
jgi:hypothetical protein